MFRLVKDILIGIVIAIPTATVFMNIDADNVQFFVSFIGGVISMALMVYTDK